MVNGINAYKAISALQPKATVVESGDSAAQLTKKFQSFLNDAISQVGNDQAKVDQLNQQFITGDLQDVHTLMIESEKATLNLQLTTQVRNKVIDAYQEIMRMQI